MFSRIRWRLVASFVLVLTLILTILSIAVYFSMARSLETQVDRSLVIQGNQIAANLRELNDTGLGVGNQAYRGGLFYLVLGTNGQLLANPQNVLVDSSVTSAILDTSSTLKTATIDGEPSRMYVQVILIQRTPVGVLVTGQSLVPEQAALQRLLVILIIGGGAGLLLSLAGAWFLSGQALVPIMRAFARQQEFVADASHELRTPLTILHSTVDLLNQHRSEPLNANGELFDDLRQEILRMERLAGDLLTLARQDLHQLDLAIGEADLGVLASDVVRRITPLAQEKQVALTYKDGAGPSLAEVDPDRIQQVLVILVDNALKHTPAGGWVTVSLGRQGSNITLKVADTGEGIPAEHLPRVFDRFYRVDQARSRARGGTGLGLAIAKSLVDAHGGQLTLSSAVGSGTVATVRLRALRASPSLAHRVGQLAARVAHRQAHY